MKNDIKCMVLRSDDFFSNSLSKKMNNLGKKRNLKFYSEKFNDTINNLNAGAFSDYNVIMLDPSLNDKYLLFYKAIDHSKTKLFQMKDSDLVISKVDNLINRLALEIEN